MKEDLPEPRWQTTPAGVVTSSHDEYFSAFRALRLSGFILDRASRMWALKRCRLSSCVLEHGADAAPWAATGSVGAGTVVVVFSSGQNASLRVDGHEVTRDVVCALRPGARATGTRSLSPWTAGRSS